MQLQHQLPRSEYDIGIRTEMNRRKRGEDETKVKCIHSSAVSEKLLTSALHHSKYSLACDYHQLLC